MKKYLLLTGVIVAFHCAYSQCDFSGQVPRYTLIEGFTSCSAPPCGVGDLNLQNVLTQNDAQGGKYTLIKYQMNWPGTGDPYYTLEGAARRNFYDVTIIPWLHVDGSGEDEILFTNNQLVDYQSILSCVEVKGSFSVEDKTVNAIIHITPTVDINESNDLRLFIAIVEKETHGNTCSSGQNTFVQVMKKFMPDTDGIELGNLTENQAIIKEQTWEFKGDYFMPYPGYIINHDIEHSVENFDNLEVVAWVQNIATKEVYNSCTATKGTSNISTNNLVAVELFPNPVTDELYISNTQQVKNITIVNMTGQTVIEALGTGDKTMVISTQYLPSGIFFVTLKNNEGVQITKKLVKK